MDGEAQDMYLRYLSQNTSRSVVKWHFTELIPDYLYIYPITSIAFSYAL